jgi:hypothetical protein
MNSVLEHDKKYAVGDNTKYASSIGRRLSSSSLLPSSAHSNNLTSVKSECPSSPFLMSRSNSTISSADQGNSQTKIGSSQNLVDKDQSSALQKFTLTKKVGTTHIFPDSPKNLGGYRSGSADGSSYSTSVVAVRSR